MRKKPNRKSPKRRTFGKSKLGSGGRFKKCVETMERRPDVDDPEALCASIGRRAYGKRKFQRMAARGRNPGWVEPGMFVKAEFSSRKGSESMWVIVEKANGKIIGRLDNEPVLLTHLKLGQRVRVPWEKVETVMRNPRRNPNYRFVGDDYDFMTALSSDEEAERYARSLSAGVRVLPYGQFVPFNYPEPLPLSVNPGSPPGTQPQASTASASMLQTLTGRQPQELVAESYTYNKNFQRGDYAANITATNIQGPYTVTVSGTGMNTEGLEFQTPEAAEYFAHHRLDELMPVGVSREIEALTGNPGLIEPIIAGASAGTAVALTNRALSNPIVIRGSKTLGPYTRPSTAYDKARALEDSGEGMFVRIEKKGKKFWVHYEPRSRGNPDAYPDSERAAAGFFEKFHGRPAEEIVTIPEDEHYHEYLGGIGDLVEIKVRTKSGYKVDLDFAGDNVMVAASEDGRQLYLTGGNQKLDLKSDHMDGKPWRKDLMNIGSIEEMTYRTEKSFDKNKTTDYFHKLSEVTKGPMPDLLYDTLNDRLKIAGGQYHIPLPMIGVSPGIVN